MHDIPDFVTSHPFCMVKLEPPFCSRSPPTLTKMQPERDLFSSQTMALPPNVANYGAGAHVDFPEKGNPCESRLEIFAGFLSLAAGKHQLHT